MLCRWLVLPVFLCFFVAHLYAQLFPYQNKKLPVEVRLNDLLSRMTLQEKAGQLNLPSAIAENGEVLLASQKEWVKEGKVGSFLNLVGVSNIKPIQEIAIKQSRLGIPLIFALDIIHGFKTIFPIPLAEACTWDTMQIRIDAMIAAKEGASAGINWTYAPMCDISYDPRWGRVMEGRGEDPFYGACAAEAAVKGFQGGLKDSLHILACAKHFIGYGAVEGGREYNFVDFSKSQLWNTYVPPFRGAIDAGVATVMNAFTVFEGVPATYNVYLMKYVLANKLHFRGCVVSDWGSISNLVNHGVASDNKMACYKAIQAGAMIDMEGFCNINYLPALVKEKKIPIEVVNEDVKRVLRLKFDLGLFDDPYRFLDTNREKENIFTPANRLQARIAADKSIVLLQNEHHILPLQSSRKIALVGYFAHSHYDLFDIWAAKGDTTQAITPYEGLQQVFPDLLYSEGYLPNGTTNDTLINEAVSQAKQADVIIVSIGISGLLAGEKKSLALPVIPNGQYELLHALRSLNKPIIALVQSGRPLVLTPLLPLCDAVLQCWILGTEEGAAIADVLTGQYNPSGKLTMSFPYAIGQIPIHYNYISDGHSSNDNKNQLIAYQDVSNQPLFPFGYGLSYTHFSYNNLHCSDTNLTSHGNIVVSVLVKNDGNMDGNEVVQLYTHQECRPTVPPVKDLKRYL